MKRRCRMDPVAEELPNHVMYVVFLNLPVKTLIRFRSLSWEWNNTISSQAFGKDHYMHNKNIAEADHLFAYYGNKDDHMVNHHMISRNELVGHDNSLLPPPITTCIQNFIQRRDICDKPQWITWSSCHGMTCTTHSCGYTSSILIWNPVTRQSRQVPFPVKYYDHRHNFIGFGYDRATDDYKIVVNSVDDDRFDTHTYVKSLKSSSNEWSIIDVQSPWEYKKSPNLHPWGLIESLAPVTLDGDIYWITECPRRHFSILKFNVTDESLAILPTPPFKHERHGDKSSWRVKLGQHQGSLCFFNYYSFTFYHPMAYSIRVWTLVQDVNGKETWNNLMNIPSVESYGKNYPIGFTKRGDLIIGFQKGILVYKSRENRFLKLYPDGFGNYTWSIWNCLLHDETLINPNHLSSQ